jgi:hypothetical protein
VLFSGGEGWGEGVTINAKCGHPDEGDLFLLDRLGLMQNLSYLIIIGLPLRPIAIDGTE